MLINEAKWIGNKISVLPLTNDSVILNFGSQTKKYNEENNHVFDYVIHPITKKYKLKNLDIRHGEGIDYSGDILNDQFFHYLKSTPFDAILLCNVLEHVKNIEELALRVGKIIKPGGFLIFSGPYEYPLHYDPIDNGFRPSVSEVVRLFNGFQVVESEIVTDFTYAYYLKKNPKQLILTILRVITPIYKFSKWKNVVLPKFLWWNKIFRVTCVIMQRNK